MSLERLLLLPSLAMLSACSYSRINVYVPTDPPAGSEQKWFEKHGHRRPINPWSDSNLVHAMTNDTLLEVVGIGGGKRLVFPDVQALLDCAHAAPPCRERVDFVSGIRFTQEEKETFLLGPLVWGMLFGLIELRHPLHEKNPEPYDWRVPLYGVAFGGALSISASFSREKFTVHFR